MKKISLFLILVICLQHKVGAQSFRYPLALPYIGLVTYSHYQSDPISFTSNQAALAQTKRPGFAAYAERRFLLAATSSCALALAMPTKLGNIGLLINYAGFKNFNESKIGLAYAKPLGNKVAVGIQFNYYSYKIPAYGNASALNYEAGVIMHVSDKLNTGFQVYNPFGTKLGKSKEEKLPATYKFGLGYDASNNFFVSAEIAKEEDKPINVIAGFQYQFAKQFFVRGGFLSESATVFAGLGVGFNNLRIDAGGSFHAQLGFSPGFLLIVNFGEEK